MNQTKSYLPSNATTTISNSSNCKEIIEIAVPLNDELVDLGYPRLPGNFKELNGTLSVKFVIDFLLLEQPNGGYVFEAETVSVDSNQFRSREAMFGRLEQLY